MVGSRFFHNQKRGVGKQPRVNQCAYKNVTVAVMAKALSQ